MYKIMQDGLIRDANEKEADDIDRRNKEAARQPVPAMITCGQGKEALYNAGLFGKVQPAIDAIEDADTNWRVQNAWDNRPTWERHSPFVIMMLDILGLSEEEADELFIDAAKL